MNLADHLWQSTLFAGMAGLLTLALARNRARVRHGVWLAASIKFLIPVSLLIALGGQFEWRKALPVTEPHVLA
jgi:bla regulator protein BlaR1